MIDKHFCILFTILIIAFGGVHPAGVSAAVLNSYVPPTFVTVDMFELVQPTGDLPLDANPCVTGSTIFGCTAFPNDLSKKYPFTTSGVSVNIEGVVVTDRYLRDVIVQEMSPASFLPAAMRAQAIAARTYIYWHIAANSEINNSNAYQVFLPYAYEAFSGPEKAIVDDALTDRYYMSYSSSFSNGFRVVEEDEPIFSEFSADAYERTVTHPEQPTRHPYLLSVEDPISFHPDIPPLIVATNAHQRGMSQNGAGRWARASSSFRCDPAPAPCNPPPSEPHTRWSTVWTDAFQILSHYYTNIHIRDANNNNQKRTPDYRWNPLTIGLLSSPAEPACRGQWLVYTLQVLVQNSGSKGWPANRLYLFGRSEVQASALAAPTGAIPQEVAPGASVLATTEILAPPNHPEGTPFAFQLDMFEENEGYFATQTPSWPILTGEFATPTRKECAAFYLPLVHKGLTFSQ